MLFLQIRAHSPSQSMHTHTHTHELSHAHTHVHVNTYMCMHAYSAHAPHAPISYTHMHVLTHACTHVKRYILVIKTPIPYPSRDTMQQWYLSLHTNGDIVVVGVSPGLRVSVVTVGPNGVHACTHAHTRMHIHTHTHSHTHTQSQ